MRRTLLAQLLLICLVALLALGGCLFGRKGGDEGAETGAGPEGAPGLSAEVAGPEGKPPEGPAGGPGPAEGPSAPEAAPLGPAAKAPAAGPATTAAPAGDAAQAKGLLAQARQAKAAADYESAISLARQAADADPGSADAHWLMAWMYAEQGQKDQAVAEFNAFVASAGGDPRVADAKAALERLGAGGGPPGAPQPPGP